MQTRLSDPQQRSPEFQRSESLPELLPTLLVSQRKPWSWSCDLQETPSLVSCLAGNPSTDTQFPRESSTSLFCVKAIPFKHEDTLTGSNARCNRPGSGSQAPPTERSELLMKQTGGFASRLHTPALQKCLSGAYLKEPPMEQPRLEERTGTLQLVSVLGEGTIAAKMH